MGLELGLDQTWINEVLKLRELPLQRPDMDSVDLAFAALLRHSNGEARATVLDHMTRLYVRAAGMCPDTAWRWRRLNAQFGERSAFVTQLKLVALTVLRIQPDGAVFGILKRIFGRP